MYCNENNRAHGEVVEKSWKGDGTAILVFFIRNKIASLTVLESVTAGQNRAAN